MERIHHGLPLACVAPPPGADFHFRQILRDDLATSPELLLHYRSYKYRATLATSEVPGMRGATNDDWLGQMAESNETMARVPGTGCSTGRKTIVGLFTGQVYHDHVAIRLDFHTGADRNRGVG
jgi:hypothetical protein